MGSAELSSSCALLALCALVVACLPRRAGAHGAVAALAISSACLVLLVLGVWREDAAPAVGAARPVWWVESLGLRWELAMRGFSRAVVLATSAIFVLAHLLQAAPGRRRGEAPSGSLGRDAAWLCLLQLALLVLCTTTSSLFFCAAAQLAIVLVAAAFVRLGEARGAAWRIACALVLFAANACALAAFAGLWASAERLGAHAWGLEELLALLRSERLEGPALAGVAFPRWTAGALVGAFAAAALVAPALACLSPARGADERDGQAGDVDESEAIGRAVALGGALVPCALVAWIKVGVPFGQPVLRDWMPWVAGLSGLTACAAALHAIWGRGFARVARGLALAHGAFLAFGLAGLRGAAWELVAADLVLAGVGLAACSGCAARLDRDAAAPRGSRGAALLVAFALTSAGLLALPHVLRVGEGEPGFAALLRPALDGASAAAYAQLGAQALLALAALRAVLLGLRARAASPEPDARSPLAAPLALGLVSALFLFTAFVPAVRARLAPSSWTDGVAAILQSVSAEEGR